MRVVIGFVVLVSFLCIASKDVRGDYVLQVGNGSGDSNPLIISQGQNVSFDVTLSKTSGSYSLTGFSLFFDLASTQGPSGFGSPAGLSSISVSNPLTNFAVTGPDSQIGNDLNLIGETTNFDFSVNGLINQGSPANPLDSAATLFRININTGTMQEGQYSLRFIADPTNSISGSMLADFPSLTGLGASGTGTSFNASFSITAVPEPSSLVLATAIVGLGVFKFRRRFVK